MIPPPTFANTLPTFANTLPTFGGGAAGTSTSNMTPITGDPEIDAFIRHSYGTLQGAGEASPSQVKWDELFGVGDTLTQGQLDILKRYSVADPRATRDYGYTWEGVGESGLQPLVGGPGVVTWFTPNAQGSPYEAVALGYNPEYAVIEGLSQDDEGRYFIDGRAVTPISVPTGQTTGNAQGILGYEALGDTPGVVGDVPAQRWMYEPTGRYSIVPGPDRYERDLQAQWQRDKEGSGFDKFMAIAAPLAMSFIPGLPAWGAGALVGGTSAAAADGDVLKGILLGGLGGFAGGAASGWAAEAGLPSWASRAVGSGTNALIRSGGDVDTAMGNALTGGLGGYFGEALPDNLRWAASPLASVSSSLLRGQQISPQSLLIRAAMAAADENTTRPRQALVKR